jgi:hypothetical protein
LSALERGLEKAIYKDSKANKAFENLVRRGYALDDLLIHLTSWARTPEILFAETLRAKIPNRDTKNKLVSFVSRLRETAAEMDSDKFQREVLDDGQLKRHWIVKGSGSVESAARLRDLPATLRLYAKLLEWQLSMELDLAEAFDKTYLGYQNEQTHLFANEVRKRTQKDRIDSVVALLNCVSRHFHVERRFEKKALSQQLKRLRKIPA